MGAKFLKSSVPAVKNYNNDKQESNEQVLPPGRCGPMIIKPEKECDESDEQEPIEEDLVIIKSEFGPRPQKPGLPNNERWQGSGSSSQQQQQAPPMAHQNQFQGNAVSVIITR